MAGFEIFGTRNVAVKNAVQTLAIACAAFVVGCFVFLSWKMINRPMWLDEIMAMTNYPLPHFIDNFRPLPYFSQAAPPSFNLVSDALALLSLPYARLAQLVLIAGSLCGLAYALYRRAWIMLAAIACECYFLNILYYSSELKYYGVEFIGACVLVAWFLKKKYWDELTITDLAVLAIGMCLGISTVILSGLVLGLFVFGFLFDRRKFSTAQLAMAASFLAFLVVYYAVVKSVVVYQMSNYQVIYDMHGLAAARSLFQTIHALFKPSAYLVMLASIAAAFWVKPSTRLIKLGVLFLVTLAAITAVSILGVYPVYTVRQIIWLLAFPTFAFLEVIWLIAHSESQNFKLGKAALFGGIAVLLNVSLGLAALQSISKPGYYDKEDSQKLAEWLNKQPPSDVGLWVGGISITNYYHDKYRNLDNHKYYGVYDVNSIKIDNRLLDKKYIDQHLRDVAIYLEKNRLTPGAYNRNVVYRIAGNYSPIAESLIDSLPKNRHAYILGFHAEISDQDARGTALRNALTSRKCAWDKALEVRGGFVLEVTCPA